VKPNLVVLAKFVAVFLFGVFILGADAFAHPEDDFCGPDSGIDPQLCEQLSKLNRADADITRPLLDEDGDVRSPLNAAVYFGKIGVQHILPGGLDHILFVLALFLVAKNFRNLVLQISIFTIAHTATLGLTAAGVIEPPGSIVEPLIALSIAVVAIEALFKKTYVKWRLAIVFGFGLFHGMGFAGFIREIGLPTEQFWPSLIGFNIGVELGQLSVVLAALLLAWPIKRMLLRAEISYRTAVVIPCSLIIASIGMWWFIVRSFGL